MKYVVVFFDKTTNRILSVAIRQTEEEAINFALEFALTIEQEISTNTSVLLSNELYYAEIKQYENNIEADNLYFNGTAFVNDPVNGEFIYLV